MMTGGAGNAGADPGSRNGDENPAGAAHRVESPIPLAVEGVRINAPASIRVGRPFAGCRFEPVKKSGEHGKHNLKSCHCLANAAEE
jgi:hypothetical protein